jgi:hypothetical protein
MARWVGATVPRQTAVERELECAMREGPADCSRTSPWVKAVPVRFADEDPVCSRDDEPYTVALRT